MDNKDILKKIKNIDGIGIIFVYIAVFAALSIACPKFPEIFKYHGRYPPGSVYCYCRFCNDVCNLYGWH